MEEQQRERKWRKGTHKSQQIAQLSGKKEGKENVTMR